MSITLKKIHPRIIHIVSSLKNGGMEQMVLRMAINQKLHGHEVAILALNSGELTSKAEENSIFVYTPAASNKIKRVYNVIRFACHYKPDIIHAHNETSLQYMRIVKLITRAKSVMTDHGISQNPIKKASMSDFSKVDVVVAVSKTTASQRESMIKRSPRVIYNGVNFSESMNNRNAIRRTLDLSSRFTGIIVARIDNHKGHKDLIDAIAVLDYRSINLTILIVGDGDQRKTMEDYARQKGLSDEVIRFLGYRTDIPDLLSACDFFVLPSLSEGMPVSILEAMASGLPVIATKVGGIPELITDRHLGILIPPHSPVHIASAVLTIYNNMDLRLTMSKEGKHHAITDFSFEHMINEYDDLYLSLL